MGRSILFFDKYKYKIIIIYHKTSIVHWNHLEDNIA